MNPELAATLQNIANLRADLTAVSAAADAAAAGDQRMPLLNHLSAAAQGTKASTANVRKLPVDLISMKVGINVVNQDSFRERTFLPAVHGFLDTVRDGHPTTPILVVTPITCPAHEDHPGPTMGTGGPIAAPERPPALSTGSLSLRRIRELLADVVATRVAGGDDHLHLLAGPELFGPDDLADLPDGLHPNSAGYARMGDRFHAWAFEGTGPFAE